MKRAMTLIFFFFLLISITLFLIDLMLKTKDAASGNGGEMYWRLDEIQYTFNIILNLLLALSLLLVTVRFFAAAKEMYGTKSLKKLSP